MAHDLAPILAAAVLVGACLLAGLVRAAAWLASLPADDGRWDDLDSTEGDS